MKIVESSIVFVNELPSDAPVGATHEIQKHEFYTNAFNLIQFVQFSSEQKKGGPWTLKNGGPDAFVQWAEFNNGIKFTGELNRGMIANTNTYELEADNPLYDIAKSYLPRINAFNLPISALGMNINVKVDKLSNLDSLLKSDLHFLKLDGYFSRGFAFTVSSCTGGLVNVNFEQREGEVIAIFNFHNSLKGMDAKTKIAGLIDKHPQYLEQVREILDGCC